MTDEIITETPINDTNTEVVETPATSETAVDIAPTTEEIIEPVAPQIPPSEDIQAIADKHAVYASGAFHLARIHDSRITQVTRIVETIMKAAERTINWTEAETVAIWDRVEAELKARIS